MLWYEEEGMKKIVILSLLLHLNSTLLSVQPIQEHSPVKNISFIKKNYFKERKKLLRTAIPIGIGLVTLVSMRFGILYGIPQFLKIFERESSELTNAIREIIPTIVSAEIQEEQYTYKNMVMHQPALFITIAHEEKVSELGFLLETREKIKALPYMQQHWPDLDKIRIRDSARKRADKNDYFIGAG